MAIVSFKEPNSTTGGAEVAHRASIAEAKSRLSALVNMVAHGRERIVLTSRGKPQAGLVGLEDLAALEDSTPARADEDGLAEADLIRARILKRRRGTLLSDSVEAISAMP